MMLRSNYTIWHFMLEDWTVWGLSDSFKTEMWQIVSLEATSLWLAQPKNVKLRWMIQHKNSSIKLGAKLLSSTHWCFSRENFFKCGSQKFAIKSKDLYVIAFHIQLLLIGYYLSSLMMQVHTYLQMSSWLCLLTKLKTIWRNICAQFTLVYNIF